MYRMQDVAPCMALAAHLVDGREEVLWPHREGLLFAKVKVLGVVVHQLRLWGTCTRPEAALDSPATCMRRAQQQQATQHCSACRCGPSIKPRQWLQLPGPRHWQSQHSPPAALAQALAMPSKVTKRCPEMLKIWPCALGLPRHLWKAVARSLTWPSWVTCKGQLSILTSTAETACWLHQAPS